MNRKKLDLGIGIFLIALTLLSMLGVLGAIGISGRFIEVVVIAVGVWLVVMGLK